MIRKVLVDADILLWKITAALERAVDWGDGCYTLHADAKEAEQELASRILEIERAFMADVVLCLSDWEQPYWRKLIFPAYKSNRVKPKPLIFRHLQEHCMEKLGAIKMAGLEGDDVLGIFATGEYRDCTLFSIDKDMDLVPCRRSKEFGFTYRVTRAEAERNHILLSFTGDSTDGFGGCPSVGAKSATKLLDSYLSGRVGAADAWQIIFAEYAKKGVSYEDALIQAQLAHVLLDGEYDLETGVVELWRPPSAVI